MSAPHPTPPDSSLPNPPPEEAPSRPRPSLARRLMWGMLLATGLFLVLAHRQIVAGWHMGLALRSYERGQLSEALKHVNRALDWTPDRRGYYLFRARLRAESGDLQGAVADYTRVIEHAPHFARAYLGRMLVYQRLGRYDLAVADAEQALAHWPAEDDPDPWNTLAYARALANRDVQRGLQEVERALRMVQERETVDPSQLSAYLDTRAFLLYRLGRHEEALADIDRALRLFNPVLESYRRAIQQRKDLPEQARRSWLQELDHHLAVMLHHRGLILQALGRTDEAKADLERARRLGYDPRKGVQ